ncbi:MAG TPA: hypothetical protein VIY68_05330 [Steroidobacteraceae bacterium]
MNNIFFCRVFLFLALTIGVAHSAESPASGYDALIQQGKSQLQAGSAERAAASGRAAIKMSGERWEGYALAGGALMNIKRYEDAADALTNAITRAPADKKLALRELRKQCLVAEAGMTTAPDRKPGNAEAVTQQEIVLWKSIESSGGPEDFRLYLQQYPRGAYAALANQRLDRLKEDDFARQVLGSKDLESIEKYLDQYPAGAHVAEVGALFPKTLFAMMSDMASSDDPCKVTVRKLWRRKIDAGNTAKNIFLAATIVGDVMLRVSYYVTFDVGTIDFRTLNPDSVAAKSVQFDQYPAVPKDSDGYDPGKTFYGIEIRQSATRIDVKLRESGFRHERGAGEFFSVSRGNCMVSGAAANKCEFKPVDVLALPVREEQTPMVLEALGRLSRMCRAGDAPVTVDQESAAKN